MGYNKLQRKMTALIYSKKRLNQVAVNTYRNYAEVRDTLNMNGTSEKRKKQDPFAATEQEPQEETKVEEK